MSSVVFKMFVADVNQVFAGHVADCCKFAGRQHQSSVSKAVVHTWHRTARDRRLPSVTRWMSSAR